MIRCLACECDEAEIEEGCSWLKCPECGFEWLPVVMEYNVESVLIPGWKAWRSVPKGCLGVFGEVS